MSKMRKILLAIAFTTIAFGANSKTPGSIKVESDSTIEKLVQKHIAYNIRHPQIDGYRIRIFRDNSASARQRSQEIASGFTFLFPDVPAYLGYDNPYFKISVGDFRTKDEALKIFPKVKREYPNAYVVPEMINLPAL